MKPYNNNNRNNNNDMTFVINDDEKYDYKSEASFFFVICKS